MPCSRTHEVPHHVAATEPHRDSCLLERSEVSIPTSPGMPLNCHRTQQSTYFIRSAATTLVFPRSPTPSHSSPCREPICFPGQCPMPLLILNSTNFSASTWRSCLLFRSEADALAPHPQLPQNLVVSQLIRSKVRTPDDPDTLPPLLPQNLIEIPWAHQEKGQHHS